MCVQSPYGPSTESVEETQVKAQDQSVAVTNKPAKTHYFRSKHPKKFSVKSKGSKMILSIHLFIFYHTFNK